MANYFILPDDRVKAKKNFIALLDRPDETLLVVLWDDDTAVDASEFVKEIAEANQSNSGFYAYVNFVIVRDPDPIIPVLKELDNESGVDLDYLDDYVIVSVSPYRNILSEAITKNRFNKGKGSVSTAILAAMANK